MSGFHAFQLLTSSTRSICSTEPSRTFARRRAALWCLLAQSKSMFFTLSTGCRFWDGFSFKNLRLAERSARVGWQGYERKGGFELLLRGWGLEDCVFVCVYICLVFAFFFFFNLGSKLVIKKFSPSFFFFSNINEGFLNEGLTFFMYFRHSIRTYQNLPCRYGRNSRCLDKNPCAPSWILFSAFIETSSSVCAFSSNSVCCFALAPDWSWHLS